MERLKEIENCVLCKLVTLTKYLTSNHSLTIDSTHKIKKTILIELAKSETHKKIDRGFHFFLHAFHDVKTNSLVKVEIQLKC